MLMKVDLTGFLLVKLFVVSSCFAVCVTLCLYFSLIQSAYITVDVFQISVRKTVILTA